MRKRTSVAAFALLLAATTVATTDSRNPSPEPRLSAVALAKAEAPSPGSEAPQDLSPKPPAPSPGSEVTNWQDLRWRNVGPTRGGRVTAIAGVRSQPCTFYMGATGGGVWKTENCGESWTPISDGQIATGSIGSIDVSESNPNVV